MIQVSRIHYLERGDKVLVMDRLNGRWLMLSAAYRPILPLLGTDRNKIYHAKLKDQVEQLENLLVSRGIGHAEPHRSNGLNTVILKLTKACNLACSYCYDFEPEDPLVIWNTIWHWMPSARPLIFVRERSILFYMEVNPCWSGP